MSEKYTYLLVNFLTIVIPFLFSFHPRIRFYRKWKYFFPALFTTAFFFIVWDSIFIRNCIWYFNPHKITGIHFLNLPMEEVLFFITVPYACVFVYEMLSKSIKISRNKTPENIIVYILIIILSVLIIFNTEKLYTFITALFLIIYVASLKFIFKVKFLHLTFLIYCVLWIPFLFVNGYLTGMFTKEAVVIYNNAENLGIRIFTIPIEDALYGFLLFLMNVSLFEFFQKALYQRQ